MRNSVFNVQSVLQFSVKTREYFQFTDFGAMLYNYYSKWEYLHLFKMHQTYAVDCMIDIHTFFARLNPTSPVITNQKAKQFVHRTINGYL